MAGRGAGDGLVQFTARILRQPIPCPPASHLLPRSLLSHCLATAKIKKAGQRIVLQMRLFVGKADITLMDGDVKRNLL